MFPGRRPKCLRASQQRECNGARRRLPRKSITLRATKTHVLEVLVIHGSRHIILCSRPTAVNECRSLEGQRIDLAQIARATRGSVIGWWPERNVLKIGVGTSVDEGTNGLLVFARIDLAL